MKRVAILISGGGSNMVRLIESMIGDHPARAVLVGSNDPGASGLAKAAALGVDTFAVDHRSFKGDRQSFEAALLEHLDRVQPDILCLAGFMRILTPDFVSKFNDRMLNIHPSLLPKYPGLHTHERAIAAGDSLAGATVHLVTSELDAGPILGQAQVRILPDDDAASLASRVLTQEHRLYPQVLRRFASGERSPVMLSAQ